MYYFTCIWLTFVVVTQPNVDVLIQSSLVCVSLFAAHQTGRFLGMLLRHDLGLAIQAKVSLASRHPSRDQAGPQINSQPISGGIPQGTANGGNHTYINHLPAVIVQSMGHPRSRPRNLYQRRSYLTSSQVLWLPHTKLGKDSLYPLPLLLKMGRS